MTQPIGRPSTFIANVMWAAKWAGGMAFLFSLYVALVALALPGAIQRKYGVSPIIILEGYWAAAAVAAMVVGVFRPVLRYRIGAFFVGSVVGTYIYGSVAWITRLTPNAPLWVYLIPGVLVGGGLGVVWRDSSFN